jgi:hypothetical protein
MHISRECRVLLTEYNDSRKSSSSQVVCAAAEEEDEAEAAEPGVEEAEKAAELCRTNRASAGSRMWRGVSRDRIESTGSPERAADKQALVWCDTGKLWVSEPQHPTEDESQ